MSSRFERQELRLLVGVISLLAALAVFLWHTVHAQEPTRGEVALIVILLVQSFGLLVPRDRLDWLASKLAPLIGPIATAILDRLPFLKNKEP